MQTLLIGTGTFPGSELLPAADYGHAAPRAVLEFIANHYDE
jgi:hypothetical protein